MFRLYFLDPVSLRSVSCVAVLADHVSHKCRSTVQDLGRYCATSYGMLAMQLIAMQWVCVLLPKEIEKAMGVVRR
jgi:hypothetical protein